MGAGLINPTHLIFLAVLGLLLFGAKRLPEVGRSLGTGMREFKSSVTGLEAPTGPAAMPTDSEIHEVAPIRVAETRSAQPEERIAEGA
jgi:sec-independent protein translocase protein TatA